MDESKSLVTFFKTHIFNTLEKAPVVQKTIVVSPLTKLVISTEIFPSNVSKVYITTKALKHLYDKKPAEEFDKILRGLYQIVGYPSNIYENKAGKRGKWVLAKRISNGLYLCPVELIEEDIFDGELQKLYVVSAFRCRDLDYLNGYKLLWSWKGDIPSS